MHLATKTLQQSELLASQGPDVLDAAIELTGISKKYRRKTAVVDFSLRVPRKSICGFLGPNGAGKTTTLRIMMGLLRPTAGGVRVLGLDPMRRGIEVRHRVGYVPDVNHIYQWMTISEVFRFAAGLFRNWEWALCDQFVERLALPKARCVKQLSRGELAKLNLIVAMSHRPELLILDEPTTGLDPLVRVEFLDAVAELAGKIGATVLFSTHILGDVDRIADRLVFMKDGRVLGADSVASLRARYVKVSFVFREPPVDGLEIPNALRVRKGIREWIAIFDASEGVDLSTIASRIDAADFLAQTVTVEDIFTELFARPKQS